MNILNRKFRFCVLKTITNYSKPCYLNYRYDLTHENFDENFEITLTNLHEALFGKIRLYLSEEKGSNFMSKVYCGAYLKFQIVLDEFDSLQSELLASNDNLNRSKKSINNLKRNQSADLSKEPVSKNIRKASKFYKKLLETQNIVKIKRKTDSIKVVLKLLKLKDIESADHFGKKAESIGTIEIEIQEITQKSEYLEQSTAQNKTDLNDTIIDKTKFIEVPIDQFNKVYVQRYEEKLEADILNSLKCKNMKNKESSELNSRSQILNNKIEKEEMKVLTKEFGQINNLKIDYVTKMIIYLKLFFLNKLPTRFLDWYLVSLLRLAFIIKEGTIACRIKVFLGFIFIQAFSKVVLSRNEIIIKDSKPCDFSRKNYFIFLKALHYSAAAYCEYPTRAFIPCKIRDVFNIDISKRHILERVQINDKNIIKVYNGDMFSTPFCAFFDNSNQLVVSFRGSSRIGDILKILNATYTPFMDGFAHEGFLNLALNFINTEFHELLKIMRKKKFKKIMFTGHSMGGAIGVLVCIISENIKKFSDKVKISHQDLKMFNSIEFSTIAFSVPPTVSKSIANQYFPHIKIFCFDKDIIPRLSFGSVLDFKYLCISVAESLFKIKKGYITRVNEFLIHSNLNEKLFSPGMTYMIKFVNENKTRSYSVLRIDSLKLVNIDLHLNSFYYHTLNSLENAFKYKLTKKDPSIE